MRNLEGPRSDASRAVCIERSIWRAAAAQAMLMPMTARIRPARPDEAPALAALARAAYGRYVARLGFEPPAMNPEFPSRIAEGGVWVLDGPEGGGRMGYVIARPDGDDWFVDNLARAPQAPRGAGRTLLAFAEAEGARRGFSTVTLYTNGVMTENQALYPRLGYIETGRRHERGMTLVLYAKALRSSA